MSPGDARREPIGRSGERVWRLRKLHQQVDAVLTENKAGTELRFFYNGELAYRRRWETAVEARKEAAAKRAELERDGWTAHW
jgi:hypothetical protein